MGGQGAVRRNHPDAAVRGPVHSPGRRTSTDRNRHPRPIRAGRRPVRLLQPVPDNTHDNRPAPGPPPPPPPPDAWLLVQRGLPRSAARSRRRPPPSHRHSFLDPDTRTESRSHMSTVTQPRLHHLALTVTDLDASVRWYEIIFDVHFLMDVPHPGGVGKILADPEMALMFALHRHDTNDGHLFAETRTGLDHAGFVAATRADPGVWHGHPHTKRRGRPDTA